MGRIWGFLGRISICAIQLALKFFLFFLRVIAARLKDGRESRPKKYLATAGARSQSVGNATVRKLHIGDQKQSKEQ